MTPNHASQPPPPAPPASQACDSDALDAESLETNLSHARLVMLPGLGCDHRLFKYQKQAFPNLEAYNWIAPLAYGKGATRDRPETLREYAQRFAEQIPTDKPFYLGGVSMGGMVAQEMAHYWQDRLPPGTVRGLFLIGTCRSGQELVWSAKLAAPFARYLPDWTVHLGRCFAPLGLRIAEDFGAEERRLVVDMLKDADPAFSRWAINAISKWEGVKSYLKFKSDIVQLHGKRDRILRFIPKHTNISFDTAGHLINLSRYQCVNRIIANQLQIGYKLSENDEKHQNYD